jgi:TPR repeat protein
VAHADGIGWRQDDQKAAEYYKIACDGGDGLGCTYLGLMYEDGRGVQANQAKALDLFKRGCADKVTIACLGVERLEN